MPAKQENDSPEDVQEILEKCIETISQLVKRPGFRWSKTNALKLLEVAEQSQSSKGRAAKAESATDARFLTLSEAAALLERYRGKKVWNKTVKSYGEQGFFKLHWVNGWKCDRQEFIEWAARAGRLKKELP